MEILETYKFNNFCSLPKDVLMGCKDTVLPEPLLRKCNVNWLTFERNTRQPYNDNLWLFRALALHLHGNEKLEEETSKFFNHFLINSEKGIVSRIKSVQLIDIPKVEDLLQLIIFFYDIDFCGWRTDWWALSTKFSKVWKKCKTFTLQQSHFLR